jgi:hypothetical protein
MDYPQPSPNSATSKKDFKNHCNSMSLYFSNTEKVKLLTWLKKVTSHFHNAIFMLSLVNLEASLMMTPLGRNM